MTEAEYIYLFALAGISIGFLFTHALFLAID